MVYRCFELSDAGGELGRNLLFRINFQYLSGIGEAGTAMLVFVVNLAACHEYGI